jgi:hypothetical protein
MNLPSLARDASARRLMERLRPILAERGTGLFSLPSSRADIRLARLLARWIGRSKTGDRLRTRLTVGGFFG